MCKNATSSNSRAVTILNNSGMLYREPQADCISSIYTLPNFDRAWTSEFRVTVANGMDSKDVAGGVVC